MVKNRAKKSAARAAAKVRNIRYPEALGTTPHAGTKQSNNRYPIHLILGSEGSEKSSTFSPLQDCHLLVTGATGSGKTTTLGHLAGSAAYQGAEVFIGDLSLATSLLSPLVPELATLASTVPDLAAMVDGLCDSLKNRMVLMSKHSASRFDKLPDSVRPAAQLLIIDEFTALIETPRTTAGSGTRQVNLTPEAKIVVNIARLARLGRAFGISVILGAHRFPPRAFSDLPGADDLYNNLTTRLLLGAATRTEKLTVLGTTSISTTGTRWWKDQAGVGSYLKPGMTLPLQVSCLPHGYELSHNHSADLMGLERTPSLMPATNLDTTILSGPLGTGKFNWPDDGEPLLSAGSMGGGKSLEPRCPENPAPEIIFEVGRMGYGRTSYELNRNLGLSLSATNPDKLVTTERVPSDGEFPFLEQSTETFEQTLAAVMKIESAPLTGNLALTPGAVGSGGTHALSRAVARATEDPLTAPWPQSVIDTLPSEVTDLATMTHGLVIITGYMGTGKSSTLSGLAALTSRQGRRTALLTEYDEFPEATKASGLSKLHTPVDDVPPMIRATSRLGYDVLAVDDYRDGQTFASAVDAAVTGTLVFMTASGPSDYQGCLDRLIEGSAPKLQRRLRGALQDMPVTVVSQEFVRGDAGASRRLEFNVDSGPAMSER